MPIWHIKITWVAKLKQSYSANLQMWATGLTWKWHGTVLGQHVDEFDNNNNNIENAIKNGNKFIVSMVKWVVCRIKNKCISAPRIKEIDCALHLHSMTHDIYMNPHVHHWKNQITTTRAPLKDKDFVRVHACAFMHEIFSNID